MPNKNSYGHRSEKSFDDLSKSSMSMMASQTRGFIDTNRNFKVMVRVRPPLPRELESSHFLPIMQVSPEGKKIVAYEYYNLDSVDPSQISEYAETTNMYTLHSFAFDYVFDQDSTQVEVYETVAKPAVMSVLQGYNATILAYGQTGTGKTHTMEGFRYNSQDPQRGIVPRCMEEIFRYIENVSNSKTTFMVRASYLQIYNEVISDLLRTERVNLHIREDKKKGVFVEGLSEWAVRSPSDIYSLIQKGALSRATASTKMNDVSSRSHAVFIIIVEQMITPEENPDEGTEIRVGKFNLVDLAGSERVRVTGATGKRLEESKKINQSLSALGNVISALTDQKQMKTHIPYRDSKITRLLEDSLGGNCITTMMAMVSPVMEAFGESLSTLKFANRAKNIKNDPIINEDIDQRALLRKYEAELKKLRTELNSRHGGHDKSSVVQLEEDRRRAEMDKMAAQEALEIRSREFMQEREERKKLEEKIRAMHSQILQGGKKVEDTPQFRNALEEHQKIIREQYEKKMQDFEKERQMIEEDKAQVDKYKQLLLKQRDIMIALTTRLNERDETIVQLQEELDAYDRIHRESEGLLEIRTNRVQQLESILKDQNIQIPPELQTDDIREDEFRGGNAHGGGANSKLYHPYTAEMVKYGEQETYNVTQTHMLTADEKVSELTQIADGQRGEIMRLRNELAEAYNANETSGFLKQEMSILNEKDSKLVFAHQEIKSSIDSIIDSLSSQNEPQKLQNVARELLNLQKLVNSLSYENNNLSLKPQQHSQSDKPPSFSMGGDQQDARKRTQGNHRHSASASRTQDEKSNANSMKNSGRASNQPNYNEIYANAVYGDETPGESHESSDRVDRNRIPNVNRQQKTASEGREPEPVVQGKQGGGAAFNMNLGGGGNVNNLGQERRPMTVEEMLKMKRGDSSKKK